MDDATFQSAADTTLADLMERIDDALGDKMEVELEAGVLTIDLDSGGQYLINKHGPMRQIWLSSPVSGAGHYDYDAGRGAWINSRSGENLTALLATELSAAAGQPMDLG
jgi:frataxin